MSDWLNGRIDASDHRVREILAAYPDDCGQRVDLGSSLRNRESLPGPLRHGGTRHARARDLARSERFDPVIFALPARRGRREVDGAFVAASNAISLSTREASTPCFFGRSKRSSSATELAQERIVAELRRASDYTLGGAPHHPDATQCASERGARAADDRADALLGRADDRPHPARSPRSHEGSLEGSAERARSRRQARSERRTRIPRSSRGLASFFRYRGRSLRSFVTGSLAGVRLPPPAKEATEDWFSPHADIHPQVRSYLLGVLNIRLGDRDAALRNTAELERPVESPKASAVARAFAGSLRAQVAQLDGKPAEALAILEETRLEIAWEAPFRSAFFSGPMNGIFAPSCCAPWGATKTRSPGRPRSRSRCSRTGRISRRLTCVARRSTRSSTTARRRSSITRASSSSGRIAMKSSGRR